MAIVKPRRSIATMGLDRQADPVSELIIPRDRKEEVVHIKGANQLLDSFYLPFESGWKRLDTGVINIAVRTHMIGVAPAVVDWWISFLHHSEEYRWWHPRDHVFSDWEAGCEPGKYLGRTHLAHEYIGPHLYKLKIHFRDPGEILDKRRFPEAKVGTAIYGYVGAIGEDAWFGRLLHLIQETPEGCVMRSRFWLGEIDPVPNPKPTHEMLEKLVPDELGAGLFAHCCEEMSILADFLPTVYRIHNADTQRPQGTR
jgi:hypothetical protein